MRPTNINIKSPKERTEYNYDLLITKKGNKLFNNYVN